jgi:hypothetical protein
MSTMTEEEKQARVAEFNKTPKQVQSAALFAFALGIVTLLRILARAHEIHLSFAKAVLYGLLMLSWCWVSGASLFARSRWGFVALIAFAILWRNLKWPTAFTQHGKPERNQSVPACPAWRI